jgi:gas vesicle protein GvpL/GvpF
VSDADLDRLIARWAERHAPELIAKAQAEALDVARARLQARLVEALLDAADARLTTPARSKDPEPADAPATEPPSDPLLWVYGVVPAGVEAPTAANGVDSQPVRLHRRAGLAALVSDVPRHRFDEQALSTQLEDMERLEALARAHEAVLQTAMAAGAVVPFRLCTIYASPQRLDAMLEREALTLTAALDRLQGMQEWGVKAFLRAPTAVSAADDPPAPATGTEYLSRKRERRDADDAGREASEGIVAGIHARLAERATAAALSRPQDRRLSGRDAEMVLNAAYLVPADEAEAFGRVVETLARRHETDGVELELTGPWPPHHFVEPAEP